MSNNKILTVSYGTFSCTLEGFDDSFGTMKAIAEYFRDLSADDRYFGAEPAQPDAEMLTRIAEREISRRVEAREHEGRIVLSASDAQTAAPALAVAAVAATQVTADEAEQIESSASQADEAVAVDETVTIEDDVAPKDVATEDDAETHPVAPDLTDSPDLTEATDLAEEDDGVVVAETIADEAVEDAAEAFFADSAEVMALDDATDEEALFENVADAGEMNDVPADDAEVVSEVAPSNEDSQEDLETDDIIDPSPAVADNIAAKLQRIRAVVSQSQKDVEEDELFEDQHAEDLDADENGVNTIEVTAEVVETVEADQPATASVVADAARDIEDALQDEVEDDDDDDIAAMLARLDKGDDAEFNVTEEIEPVQETSNTKEDDLGLDTLAALLAADDGQADPEDADDNIFDEHAAPELTEAEDAPEAKDASGAEGAEDTTAVEEEVAAPVQPRRTRIVKVKRADIDEALASGQLEEIEDDEADSAADTSLSRKDEADLLAELAEVEAELDEVETELDDETSQPENTANDIDTIIAESDKDGHVVEEAEVKDDDVTRLMAEADNQMDEPEGHGRRSAFAHLKAAVMAKKADADIGNDSIKDEGAFRSDLASAVKPRRPTADGTRAERAERPDSSESTPLKLVAEQRVDVQPVDAGPVRPRRVTAVQAPEPAMDAQGGFADYAADQGAHDLPALLEAAASYLSFVEGRDQFSRPQLMNKVRQVEKDDFSREDGLRSFGQLLRAGKIEKTKGGRFAVTGDIGFRPDERAAS
ncbi:hypothetical protein [Tateyamaria sp.]|uniref:hypothetical protein n=1 Tax=Tateyamaria sp. TaxID=1929288 RepID=UPI00329D6283